MFSYDCQHYNAQCDDHPISATLADLRDGYSSHHRIHHPNSVFDFFIRATSRDFNNDPAIDNIADYHAQSSAFCGLRDYNGYNHGVCHCHSPVGVLLCPIAEHLDHDRPLHNDCERTSVLGHRDYNGRYDRVCDRYLFVDITIRALS